MSKSREAAVEALTAPGAPFELADLVIAARQEPGTDGIDLVAQVTTPEPYTVSSGVPRGTEYRVVAVDYAEPAAALYGGPTPRKFVAGA